jgi:hypothetical protein
MGEGFTFRAQAPDNQDTWTLRKFHCLNANCEVKPKARNLVIRISRPHFKSSRAEPFDDAPTLLFAKILPACDFNKIAQLIRNKLLNPSLTAQRA